MNKKNFFSHIKKIAEKFRNIDKKEVIRLISHHDADGICSASIMIKAFENEAFSYNLSIIKQLEETNLKEYQKEAYKIYFFTDLGSGQYELIKKYLSEKIVFILDHHSFDINLLNDNPENINMVNPHMFNIDGSNEISGSGVSYLFAEALNEKNKPYSYLAIVGSLGDVQEKNGFISLNKEILNTAMREGKVKIEKNLRYFGLETKPLYYLLAYGDIYLPNISGKESNAIQFLYDIGIEPKINNKWKKFNDLTEEEKKILISSIILKRNSLTDSHNIIGNRYLLVDEPENSPLRDLKEFATLINACGRLEKASLGIGVCLNNDELKKMAFKLQDEYKKEIISGLNWYESNVKNIELNFDINDKNINDYFLKNDVVKSDKFIIINAKNNILPSIIGTIASIISNTEIKPGTLILALAYDNDKIKASLRIKEDKKIKENKLTEKIIREKLTNENYFNLKEFITKISEKVNCQAGGHKNAAGAIIPKENEELFIREFIRLALTK